MMPPGMRHLPFGGQDRRAATGRTRSRRPSTPVTSTDSPGCTVSSLSAVQYSPRTSTVPCGSRRCRATPTAPSMPSRPPVGRRRCDRHDERPHHEPRQRERAGSTRDQAARDLEARALGVEEEERAEHEGDQAADAEDAEGRQEGLRHQQRDAER